MGEVRVVLKSAFGLFSSKNAAPQIPESAAKAKSKAGGSRASPTDAEPSSSSSSALNTYVKVSLLSKSKVLDTFTSTIIKGVQDPEWDEEFVFAKVKHDALSIKFEAYHTPDGKSSSGKEVEFLGCCHVQELRKIRNLEVQRKLMNAKCNEIVDGVLFAEYSNVPDLSKIQGDPQDHLPPEADGVDGDDAGCFCGFVYVEAVDAIDLDAAHLLVKKRRADDEDSDDEDENNLAPKQKVDWNTIMEVTCTKQCKSRKVGFSWRSLEVEGIEVGKSKFTSVGLMKIRMLVMLIPVVLSLHHFCAADVEFIHPLSPGTPNPAWNEGCSFPIDFESSDHLKPVKIRVLQDEGLVGSTFCDIPLTPVSRIYIKRIHDDISMQVRGYVVVKVGFVPFGFRVSDLLTETVMDEMATADFLGMRRKYADVISQNHEYQDAVVSLQDKIDDLEGIKKPDQDVEKEQEEKLEKKGPSVKARWHFFAMAAEPWSKATKVSAYRLRLLLEESLPDRRHQVVPMIRAMTSSAYLNFRETNQLLNEFHLTKREWKKLVGSVLKGNMQMPTERIEVLA
ncbi:unnamed protein product [Amoebophrya sp. A120]|nr:unnamed protein product [Amoebophrya sp. A120]|eukprot:GSA120T00012662001.1